MPRSTYIFILIIILASCKKESDSGPGPVPQGYDTIFPLSYFPVYPGSYWVYVDSMLDTATIRTDSLYRLDHYYTSDTFYVPIYEGTPIWGYEAHTGPISHSGSYPLTRILSDTLPVGSSWVIHHWMGTGISRKIVARDTGIIVFGNKYEPTIIIEEYYSEGPPTYIWIARRYYTKDIGLIREDIYNSQDSATNTKLLIEYYIDNG